MDRAAALIDTAPCESPQSLQNSYYRTANPAGGQSFHSARQLPAASLSEEILRPVFVLALGGAAFAALGAWCISQHARDAMAGQLPPMEAPAMVETFPIRQPPAPRLDSVSSVGARVAVAIADRLRGRTIEFETGRAVLTTRGRAILDSLAPLLVGAPKERFEVGGHSDATGDPALNQRLSEQRSAAVKQYLVTQGIPDAQLTSRGYGATRPLSTDTTALARQRNRRIEFTPLPER